MAATPTPSALSGLARALVQAGRLKEAEAEAMLVQATATRNVLALNLVKFTLMNFTDL